MVMFSACEDKPDGVIPRGEMEEILFDYHLTQGIIDIQPPEDYTHNQRYLDAVYANHGVTEAQFDSSMVYYTRQGTILKEMYENINRRFKDIEEQLKLQSGNDNLQLMMTASGDTANIWTEGSTIILRSTPLENKHIFAIRNDSTLFRPKDRIRLMFNTMFFKDMTDDKTNYAEVGITLEFKSGKTIGVNRMVNSNVPVELNLIADNEDIKALYGYFVYTGNEKTRNLGIMTNIALIRMHDMTVPAPADTVANDSVKTDSVKADSLKNDSAALKDKKHLTPQELLKRSRTKERIKIKAAPDVRTRNSYGPRRKKKNTRSK